LRANKTLLFTKCRTIQPRRDDFRRAFIEIVSESGTGALSPSANFGVTAKVENK
jgi:hypothetical protein